MNLNAGNLKKRCRMIRPFATEIRKPDIHSGRPHVMIWLLCRVLYDTILLVACLGKAVILVIKVKISSTPKS